MRESLECDLGFRQGLYRDPGSARHVLHSAVARQLQRVDVDKLDLEMSVGYRRILRVRRGVYALPDTPPLVLRALRAGGRLACVSALEFYGEGPAASDLHIAVPASASRLPAAGELGSG